LAGVEADAENRFDVARRIVQTMSLAFGAPRRTVADTVAAGLGQRDHRRSFEVALIVCADHELNASTFVARVAAGVRASIGAVIGASLFTVTGARHGTSPDDIEDVIATLPRRGLAREVKRLARAAPLPGFGHNLYPDGDPRGRILLALVQGDRMMKRRAARVLSFIDEGRALGEEPRVDLGLVALCAALDAPPRTASGIFALGRTAGWLAHAFEQLDAVDSIRPRARYVGPTRAADEKSRG
jgi:citrate synthase